MASLRAAVSPALRTRRRPTHQAGRPADCALRSSMPWSGLEPLCLTAPPPQDGVSTNFTTRAESAASSLHPAAGAPSLFFAASCTGPTGLEPATSRVTVECSNQTELRPQLWSQGRKPLPHFTFHPGLVVSQSVPRNQSYRIRIAALRNSPKGNRTPLCTVKGCRPNR